MLTQSQLQELLQYDPETGVFTWKTTIGGRTIGETAGFLENNGYIRIAINRRRYQAHRLAWLYTHGRFPSHFIDHKNGVKTDNRIVNLREASSSQNGMNQTRKNGSKGVHFHKVIGKWCARISVDGKRIELGYFETKEQAQSAYRTASVTYHGEYGRIQ